MINRDNKPNQASNSEVLLPLFESMQKMNQGLENENIALKKEILELKTNFKNEITSLIEKLESVKGNIS